ncbi:MAG: secreted PhoX family phosphatase, partial [Reinekea sp.]
MENDQHKTVAFDSILEKAVSRRSIIKSGGAIGATSFLGGASALASAATQATFLMGFEQVAASTADEITLPPGS